MSACRRLGGNGRELKIENRADEQLEGLGFPRQAVLQAFLLCDRNEELAANFLFDAGEED